MIVPFQNLRTVAYDCLKEETKSPSAGTVSPETESAISYDSDSSDEADAVAKGPHVVPYSFVGKNS